MKGIDYAPAGLSSPSMPDTRMKVCVSCRTEKPITEFPTRRSRAAIPIPPIVRSNCKKCSNVRTVGSRRRARGITPAQYQKMVTLQCGTCAICGQPETAARRSLNTDHCHKLGTNRDLLCSRCNTGLGLFQDDPALLAVAIDYLKEWAEK